MESVNDGNNFAVLREALPLLCWHKRPQLVDVDGWAPVGVAGEMEMAHTDLTEVTRMVLVEVGTGNENHIRISRS